MAEHKLSANPTHSRWNRTLAPRIRIQPGDTVHLECLEASGAQVNPKTTLSEFLAIDQQRIHALTGPIFVERAEPGDVLQIDVLKVAHRGWGWSSVIAGLGLLKERFAEPFLFHWKLEGPVSRSLSPAMVPLRPFCGVMGVARAEDGEFSTIPPALSAEIWMFASFARAPRCISLSSIPARFFPPVTPTPPKATARSASPASNAPRT